MLLITEIMFTVWISIKTDTGHILLLVSCLYQLLQQSLFTQWSLLSDIGKNLNLIILSPYVLDLILK